MCCFLLGFTIFNLMILLHFRTVCAIKRDQQQNEQPQQLPPCNEENLMYYLADLRAVSPEAILLFATSSPISETCHTLDSKLDQIDEFLGSCKLTTSGLYIQLIRGVDALYDYLCNSTHGYSWASYFPCYHALNNDYSSCVGPGDWMEYTEQEPLCKAYRCISDCYYIKTAMVCGAKPAKTMKTFIRYIFDKILGFTCPNVNAVPKVSNPYVPGESNEQTKVEPHSRPLLHLSSSATIRIYGDLILVILMYGLFFIL